MNVMKMSSKIEAVQEEEEAELPDNNNDSEKENLMQTVAGKITFTGLLFSNLCQLIVT